MSKELEQTDPYYNSHFISKGVIRDINCKPYGDLKIVLLLCTEDHLRVSSDISLR